MSWRWRIVLFAAAVSGCAGPQVRNGETIEVAGVPLFVSDTLARFEAATSMDVAPDGRIYVADRGRDAIIVISETGIRTEGGPGTESGQFDDPAAVDAGSGLVIHVADAGNHRVQRFSREFRHLGNVAVDADRFRRGRVAGDDRTGAVADRSRASSGRPVDLTTSSADELFVVDEVENVVLKWDEARRPERIIGDFGSGAGQLLDPVGVATDGDRYLYVADARRREVVVFDLLGSFVRVLRIPNGEAPTGVSAGAAGRLYVTSQVYVYVYDEAELAVALRPATDDAVIHVAERDGTLLLLTASHLFRAARPPVSQ